MAGKKADKTPKKGDNLKLTDEESKVLLQMAKKQKKLNDEKEATQADWRTRHKEISGALQEVGISRASFDVEFDLWMAKQNADTPEEEKKAIQRELVFRDECRKVHAALNDGAQLDMLTIAAEANVAREDLAKAEEQAEEGTEKPL